MTDHDDDKSLMRHLLRRDSLTDADEFWTHCYEQASDNAAVDTQWLRLAEVRYLGVIADALTELVGRDRA